MDFCEEYPRLAPRLQEHLKEVVTRLLSGHVITPGDPLAPDPDWRFAEKYDALIDAYLQIGGWRLEIDEALRLCRAIHTSGKQRVQFSKIESLVLCQLRIVYHEQMQTVTEEDVCEVTVGELRERLVQAGRPANTLSKTAMLKALRRLSRHELISTDRGFNAEDDERIEVRSLIEKVLPPDRIDEIYVQLRKYLGDDE